MVGVWGARCATVETTSVEQRVRSCVSAYLIDISGLFRHFDVMFHGAKLSPTTWSGHFFAQYRAESQGSMRLLTASTGQGAGDHTTNQPYPPSNFARRERLGCQRPSRPGPSLPEHTPCRMMDTDDANGSRHTPASPGSYRHKPTARAQAQLAATSRFGRFTPSG